MKKNKYLPLTEEFVCYANQYKDLSIEELTNIKNSTNSEEIKKQCDFIIKELNEGNENTFVLTDNTTMAIVMEKNKSIVHWVDSDGEVDDIFDGVVYSCSWDILGCHRDDGGEDEVYIECILV